MTETLHPEVADLLRRYRDELRHRESSAELDARIDVLVAARGGAHRGGWQVRRAPLWAAAAGVATLIVAAGILIGMRLERASPQLAQLPAQAPIPADFQLWPADSVALQIPAEYSDQGTLVAVDPHAHRTGKRYWVDVVVSNDGSVRIERVVPAESDDDAKLQNP